VTWVGLVANRLSGVIGCAVIAAYFWWLPLADTDDLAQNSSESI